MCWVSSCTGVAAASVVASVGDVGSPPAARKGRGLGKAESAVPLAWYFCGGWTGCVGESLLSGLGGVSMWKAWVAERVCVRSGVEGWCWLRGLAGVVPSVVLAT
jgi:hypothetical protein